MLNDFPKQNLATLASRYVLITSTTGSFCYNNDADLQPSLVCTLTLLSLHKTLSFIKKIFLAVATILSIPPKISIEEFILPPYLQVCATLSVNEKIEKNITTMLASRNDNAIAGIDYELLQKMITFTSGSMNGDEKCITIKLLFDRIIEESEMFALIWTTLDKQVVLEINITVITIIDTDC